MTSRKAETPRTSSCLWTAGDNSLVGLNLLANCLTRGGVVAGVRVGGAGDWALQAVWRCADFLVVHMTGCSEACTASAREAAQGV